MIILNIPLGKSKSLLVSRKNISDFTQTNFLSSDITRNFRYELKFKNNSKKTAQIKVYDQIPLSNHEDISIDIININDAKLNNKSGEVVWNLELEKNEEIKKTLEFEITHPSDKMIQSYK